MIIILFCMWITGHAFNRTCDFQSSCINDLIQCPDDDPNCDLYINCNGRRVCDTAIIDCSSASSCHLQCDGDSACSDLSIECPENSTCSINCISEAHGTCSDITITGATHTILNINCHGDDACIGGDIHCAQSKECNVDCYGDYSCGDKYTPLKLRGRQAETLNLQQCIGSAKNYHACDSIRVYCPMHNGNGPRCNLPGIDAHECTIFLQLRTLQARECLVVVLRFMQ